MAADRKGERWRVDFVNVRSRDSYFESDDQYEFRVVDTVTGKVFKTFWRDEYSSPHGSTNRGAKRVRLSLDGRFVEVDYEDGSAEIYPLPPTGWKKALFDGVSAVRRAWRWARQAGTRSPPP